MYPYCKETTYLFRFVSICNFAIILKFPGHFEKIQYSFRESHYSKQDEFYYRLNIAKGDDCERLKFWFFENSFSTREPDRSLYSSSGSSSR